MNNEIEHENICVALFDVVPVNNVNVVTPVSRARTNRIFTSGCQLEFGALCMLEKDKAEDIDIVKR